MPSSGGNARAGLKTKRAAWQRAKEAADAFEATALGKGEADAPGRAVKQEPLLLDGLRNESHADAVGEAWIRIERYCKNGDDQRVVMRLLEAFTDISGADWDSIWGQYCRIGRASNNRSAIQVVLRTQNTDFVCLQPRKRVRTSHLASPTADYVPIKDGDHIGRQWSDGGVMRPF
jgi:hypothetical protein